ncbi:MAG: hypothetical protein IKX20_02715 [Paludibacteraceae bacterium]|nr:hypothetical protein [Paludibacteraceae bacterium]
MALLKEEIWTLGIISNYAQILTDPRAALLSESCSFFDEEGTEYTYEQYSFTSLRPPWGYSARSSTRSGST